MKYIKKFNESTIVDKVKLNIEDLLVVFIDSGELSEYTISQSKGDSYTYHIDLIYNEGMIGMAKVKFLDKMVNRLSKKYKGIYCYDGEIYLSLVDENGYLLSDNERSIYDGDSGILTYGIEKKMLGTINMLNHLYLIRYEITQSTPRRNMLVEFYGINEDRPLFYIRKRNDVYSNKLSVTDNLISMFTFDLLLNNSDALDIIKSECIPAINKKFGFNVEEITHYE